MKKIGLIGAMDEEVAIIKEEMTNTNEVTKAGMTLWKEILRNQNRCRCKWNWQGQYGSLHPDSL